MSPRKIEKEEIAQLHFTSDDVLSDKAQKEQRDHALYDAMVLGNTQKQKCKIVFHAAEGDNYVETTIWAVTDKYICLKGGMALLIASIIEVVL